MGNRWTVIVVAVVFLPLAGCMAYTQGDLPEVREWPPRVSPERQRPSVSLSIKSESYFNGEKWEGDHHQAVEEVLQGATKVFEQSALFSRVRRANDPADLEVDFEWLRKGTCNKLVGMLSVCTLGVVPLICHGEVQTRATFRRRSGTPLGVVEMGERVTEIGWVLSFPVALFYSSPTQVHAEIEVDVFRATLVEALRRGYLDP